VAAKFEVAVNAGLTPILCVGETLQERDAGITETVVGRQLAAVIDKVGVATLAKAVLAYEPVWAIGTGKTATPEQAQAVHDYVRTTVARQNAAIADGCGYFTAAASRPRMAATLFAMRDIDGGLIGGAFTGRRGVHRDLPGRRARRAQTGLTRAIWKL
jgi:triosephosphate isomerase